MTAAAETYLGLAYTTQVVPEPTTDGGMTYVANHPDLPGCMAHGDTPEEALQNLNEARQLYIRTLVERGIEVPKPGSGAVTAVWRSYGYIPSAEFSA